MYVLLWLSGDKIYRVQYPNLTTTARTLGLDDIIDENYLGGRGNVAGSYRSIETMFAYSLDILRKTGGPFIEKGVNISRVDFNRL